MATIRLIKNKSEKKLRLKKLLDNTSSVDRFLVGVFCISSVLYYTFRPLEGTIFLMFLGILFTINLQNKNISVKGKLVKRLIIAGSILYLIYSYFNTRTSSYDGLNVHLKYILQIAGKGYVNSTEYPIKPYLGEIILSKVYTSLGLRALNLTFGLLSLLNIYLAYKVLMELTKENEKSVAQLALLIFTLSPTFLGMAFQELKVDLIASGLVLSALLLFCNLHSRKTTAIFFTLATVLGLINITKTSAIPISITTMVLGFFLILLKKKVGVLKKIGLIVAGTFIFLAPMIVWATIFGGTIPQLENHINVQPFHQKSVNVVNLKRNKKLLETCNKDKLKKDYGSFVYGARSLLVLAQPIFYLSRYKAYPFSIQGMANPGIAVYFGLIMFPIAPIIFKNKKLKEIHKLIFLITIIPTILFYIMVSSIFWYLLPLYPIYALITAYFIKNLESEKIKEALKSLIYASLATNFTLALIITFLNFESLKSLDKENIMNSSFGNLYEINMEIAALSGDSLILDASEHGHTVLTTFIPKGDEKIVKSNYYFATSNKLLSEMKEELLQNNIHYLMVKKDKLKDPWYQGCPKQNNITLYNFIQEYTKPVFPEEPKYESLFFEIIP